MTKGGPGYSSSTMMTLMIQTGFNTGRTAYDCAFAVVFFVIVFSISKAVMALLHKWEGIR
jgi:raffinose/stachyose/melibiose transport system permease protein